MVDFSPVFMDFFPMQRMSFSTFLEEKALILAEEEVFSGL
jgi:hypothetical protein